MKEKHVIEQMLAYYAGDPKRIQHFLKVYDFATMIAEDEVTHGSMNQQEQEIVRVAALVHDIGIKIAEEKYGSSNGKLQEQEGPAEAEKLLNQLGIYPDSLVVRVCYLVGHHHTYNQIEGMDYQILVEADFLVNMYEDEMDTVYIKNAYERIFKTRKGKELCRVMYGI